MRHDSRLAPPPPQRETKRQWLAGLAITITTLVALFGFWRLSPGLTFGIAVAALIGLLISFWIAGKPD